MYKNGEKLYQTIFLKTLFDFIVKLIFDKKKFVHNKVSKYICYKATDKLFRQKLYIKYKF